MTVNLKATVAVLALVGGCTTTPQGAGTSTPMPSVAGVIVPGSQEDFLANAGDRIFFDFDRSEISGRGALTQNNATTLEHQAAWLTKNNRTNVEIAGNCDERGTEEYNLALGQRRADIDSHYLIAKGIAPGRISTISYGKERPIALGSTEDAWAQNRNALTSVK